MTDFHSKIRSLRSHIKAWNSNHFGDCESIVKSLESLLENCDRGLSPSTNRRRLEQELQKAYMDREAFFKPKSRVLWDQQGDANTKFFHLMAKHKQKNDHIHGIFSEGSWLSKPLEIKQVDFNHFNNLFKEMDKTYIFSLGSLVVNKLSDIEVNHLIKEIPMQ